MLITKVVPREKNILCKVTHDTFQFAFDESEKLKENSGKEDLTEFVSFIISTKYKKMR